MTIEVRAQPVRYFNRDIINDLLPLCNFIIQEFLPNLQRTISDISFRGHFVMLATFNLFIFLLFMCLFMVCLTIIVKPPYKQFFGTETTVVYIGEIAYIEDLHTVNL